MLTGPELGAAIESARLAKGVSKKRLAEDFGVKPPSVQGWVKSGRIDKRKLMELIEYFSDVASPQHWGLDYKLYGHSYADAARATRLHAAVEGDVEIPDLQVIAISDEYSPFEGDNVWLSNLKEVEAPEGGAFEIREVEGSTLRFNRRGLRQVGVEPNNAKCVIVRGNSMNPVLLDNATVAVDVGKKTLTSIIDGNLYAVSVAGQLKVRQVFRLPDGIRLRCFNREDYPDEDYSFSDLRDGTIGMIGHVFWWGMFSR